MDFSIYDLVSKIDDKVDKKEILKELAKCVECKKNEKEIYKCLYKKIYEHLNADCCEYWISLMNNEEEEGEKWTLDETNAVARRLDCDFDTKPYTPEEFRLVMTMEYYEHNIPLKKAGTQLEPTGWGRMADYKLTKENANNKLIDEFFWTIKNL